MTRRAPTRQAILAAVAVFLGFDVLAVAAALWWTGSGRADRERAATWAADARTQADEILVREVARGADHAVWQLEGLETVPVYAIAPAPDGDGAWLGTGLGLVRLRPGERARRFRHFPDAPREWARHVTVAEHGVVLTLAVAPGNTKGSPTGTWLFDPIGERFERIGEPSRALVSDGRDLYGVQSRALVRFVRDSPRWRVEPLDAGDAKICRTAELAASADALWITGQGMVRVGRYQSKEVTCGVARIEPHRDVVAWEEADGLASGFGRDVVADARTVVVSHGIQGDGLSVLDPRNMSWRRLRGASGIRLNANALALSPAAIWLATPDGRRPFVRYDRARGEARRIDAVPDDHWVRALAGDRDGVWAAFVREQWQDGVPQVETWILRVRDRAPATVQRLP